MRKFKGSNYFLKDALLELAEPKEFEAGPLAKILLLNIQLFTCVCFF